MLRGSDWAARRDQAFALVEEPQQRHLADWREQRARRRAELEEKTARREAEFTALISAISAQVAAEVSAAVAAALETARVGHHEGLNHAPTTTSAPTASVADDHGLDLAPATTSTATRSVAANYDPTATSTSPAPPSVTTECLVHGGDLAVRPPTTCSMVCQGGGPSSPSAAPNPAEVLEPVASPPPIPVAVAYSYSSVTGPAPHADMQLVHEDVLQPETFTGSISVPPSALAADLALTRTAATSTTAQAVLEIVAVPSTPLLADSLLADRVVNHDDLYFQSFSAVTARPLPTTPTIASTDQDTTLALESDFTTARPITCSTICAEGDTSVAASQEFTHATSIITNGKFVPGNKMLCEPWNTTYPCSDQRCLCNPMEFEMHALCIPACGSTKLQVGSLLHQMYVKCSFAILQYPLSANHKLLWNFLDGAQTSGMLLVLQFVDNLSLVLALWGPSSCQISFVAKLVVHLQSEKLWLYHPSYGSTCCLSNISIVQGEPSCSFLFGLQLEPWPSWELSILVVHCHFASVHFQRKFAMQKYISSCVFLVIPIGAAEFWQGEVLHGCEKFQWTIAWLIDFLELVTASFLQAVILYWSAHYPLSCGFELLQWEIAWLLDFSYIVVDNKLRLPVQCDPSLWRSVELIQKWMISFSLVKLQPWPSLWKYSSCMESLSESFPWYIAWSCAGSDSDGSGTLTSLRKYLGSWEELLTPTKDALHLQQANNTCHFLPPAGPPATCDTWVLLMAHGLLNALICGVLLVQSYSRLVLQVITCCPMKHSFRNLVIPRAVDTMLNKYTTCYAWRLSNVTFLQASTDSCFIRYSGLRGCELVYWKIAWPLNLVYSTCGNMSRKLFHLIKVRCEGYIQKGNAALPPFSTRTVRVCLLIYWSRFYHTEISGSNYLTSGTKSTVPFQFLASVATWTFRGLEFCHRKLPWDPGIWALLCFFGSFTRAEAKGRRSAAAPAYCHCLDHAYYVDKVRADQDYYLDVSRDQVHIGNDYYLGIFLEQVDAVPYLNLIKVRLDYGTHRDLGEVMKHQVPWDPGGSTWHRLEVKPKFKEGGMLATNPTLAWAGPKAVGLGLHRSLRRKQLHIRSECLRTRRLGKGRLRPPQLLSASSSSAPLPVAWGEPTMVEAEKMLFAAALEDPANQRFVLLSDSCVPLYNFSFTYTYLMNSPKSIVDSFIDKTEKRYNPNMSPVIPKDKWRKGSQWIMLIRKHAELVVGDKHVFKVFRKHCKMIVTKALLGQKPNARRLGFVFRRKQILKGVAQKEHDCIPDEHYVQTIFSTKGLEDELERRTLTYTSWNQSSLDHKDKLTWHPTTFEYETSSPEHINAIKSIDHVNYEVEHRTEWCQCNGTSVPCFLFARKFSYGAAMHLLEDGALGLQKSAQLLVNF